MSIKEQLYTPLEVRSRRGRGGEFIYVAWQDVADRLNTVFGINWSSELKASEIVGPNIIIRVRVTVQDPETGNNYWQEGFGGALLDERLEAGSPFKAAYSKAIKDACKKYGIGLYLEDDDKPSDSTETNSVGNEYSVSVPPSLPTTKPVMQNIPKPVVESKQELNPFMPTMTPPVLEPTDMSIPETSIPTLPPTAPIQPVSNSVPPALPNVSEGPTLTSPGVIDIGKSGISDVQKVALEGLLLSRNIAFGVLAREAFDVNGITKKVPASKDDLTYDEAVAIIKYGNDKFRKA